MVPRHVAETVVVREALIDHGEVGVDELQGAPVRAEQLAEELHRLAHHGLLQPVIEGGVHLAIHLQVVHQGEVQPLPHEAIGEAVRSRIREHSIHLGLQRAGLPKLARAGPLEQRLVRGAAPQEQREPHGELQLRDWSAGTLILLHDHVEEVGGSQDHREHLPHGLLKRVSRAAELTEQLHLL